MNKEKFNAMYEEIKEMGMSEESKNYLNELYEEVNKEKEVKPLTETGISILRFMKEAKSPETTTYIAKDIANGISISSRSVSGAMRKLVTDGYVKKAGSDPIIYALDKKGLEYSLS